MNRAALFATALVLGPALGLGCATPSQPEVFHTLRPLSAQGQMASSLAVEVLPVRLPELLHRPQLVLAQGSEDLGLSETHRWADPLELGMQRVLVADLSALLGSDAVVASPYGDRVKAKYRVEVDVQRCDARGGGALSLEATWMVTKPGGGQALLFRRTALQAPLKGSDADALVAAHSQVLADLSREIAAGLKAVDAAAN